MPDIKNGQLECTGEPTRDARKPAHYALARSAKGHSLSRVVDHARFKLVCREREYARGSGTVLLECSNGAD